MFNKIRTIGKIAKTVSSPITHARNIIKSTFSKKTNQSKISPDIKQPRQLKQTMKKMRSEYEKFGFKKAKTAEDRANIVRTKKSIERMNKLEDLKKKRKEGIKASKETKKMIGTGQAEKVGGSVYHRGIREKKAEGGVLKKLKKNDPDKKLRKEGKLPPLKMFKKKQDKKKDRLEELRKELGMKKGGKAKFPDLTGDGKVTRADILKGRGVFRKGGASK